MRLKKLTITNFGIYRGVNTFEFPYTDDKKVSLIIGNNGSGKTTFLNAIKVSLFGSMILGNSTITRNYEAFIRNKLNKDALLSKYSTYSITATFISQLHKFDGEFTIKRSWNIHRGFKEIVVMEHNGVPVSTDDQEAFFNVFYHAFPLDLFELFYLDGEKIDQLSVLNSNVIDLIESSINIDLFKQLNIDLAKYASQKVNSKYLNKLNTDKDELEAKHADLIFRLTGYETELAAVKESLKNEEKALKAFRKTLNLTDVNYNSQEYEELKYQIKLLKQEIETYLTSYLQYTLIEDQLFSLLNAIEHEAFTKKRQIIASALTSPELANNVLADHEPEDRPKLEALLRSICTYYGTDAEEFVHHLNEDEYHTLHARLTKLRTFNQENDLASNITVLSTLEDKERTLNKEAEERAAAEQSGQLDILLQHQGDVKSLEIEVSDLQSLISETTNEITQTEHTLKDINKELWSELKKHNVNSVLDKMHEVMERYISRIKEKKVHQIELLTSTMFNKLIRKESFIKTCTLADEAIYLTDYSGNKLDHTNLSAGEKQLFILSLIHAILQSSERKVPLMFDTLLGRLDQEHRENVFSEFISACPDQVIILATDSEIANIDTELIDSLTNTEYTIDFSKKADVSFKAVTP